MRNTLRKHGLSLGLVGTLLAGAASPVAAECLDDLAEVRERFQPTLRALDGYYREDVRVLSEAARVLARAKREDACHELVEDIEDYLEDRRRFLVEQGLIVSPQERDRLARLAAAQPLSELAGPLRARELAGVELANRKGERLAEVEDVILVDGRSTHLLVEFGGLLGLGEDRVAVPVDLVRVTEDGRTVVVDLPREEFRQAPRVKRDRLTDPSWIEENRGWFEARLQPK